MKSVVDLVDIYFWPVVLSCAGACIQCLRGPWKGWWNMILSNAMAAFSAIVCMCILPHYVPYDFAAGIAGIFGYSGGILIDAILDRMQREISTHEMKK